MRWLAAESLDRTATDALRTTCSLEIASHENVYGWRAAVVRTGCAGHRRVQRQISPESRSVSRVAWGQYNKFGHRHPLYERLVRMA